MTNLSDLLNSVKPTEWSYREVARQAQSRGHKLAPATATAYFGGRHGEPDDATLQALSAVLPVGIEKLREAAGLPTHATPYLPPPESSRLGRKERRVVDELIRLLADRPVAEAKKAGRWNPGVASHGLSDSEADIAAHSKKDDYK